MLHGILVTLITNLEKIHVKLPQEAIRKVASRRKIKQLQLFFATRTQSTFHEAVPKTAPKIDIILHFLAMLELAKQQYVTVEQTETWGEITLKSIAQIVYDYCSIRSTVIYCRPAVKYGCHCPASWYHH